MTVMVPWREGEASGTPGPSPSDEQPPPATGWERAGPEGRAQARDPWPSTGDPLTGMQMLGSKSGQVMLETEEMSWF